VQPINFVTLTRVTNNASCNWVNSVKVSSVQFVCCERGLTSIFSTTSHLYHVGYVRATFRAGHARWGRDAVGGQFMNELLTVKDRCRY